LHVLFSVVCILFLHCLYIVVCIVSPFVYSCPPLISVQVYRPLPPGGHTIAVNKYRIVSKEGQAESG